MSLTVRILGNDEHEAWNRFVEQHPEGTIFHTTHWLNIIGPGIEVIGVFSGEELKAGLAAIRSVRNRVSGLHIPAYTQYFSPLYKYHITKRSLTEEHECIRLILEKTGKEKHIDFKLPRGHQSILPYHWKGFESAVRITHVIEGSLETYLSNLHKNKARELKKLETLIAEQALSVSEDISEEELRFLFKQTSERKGFDAQDAIAIRLVMDAGKSFTKKIVIRSKEHGLLAFGFFPFDSKAVYNLINVSVRVTDPVLKTVNLLLLYRAIEFALTNKRIFDFEGSMLPGVEAFCRLMGGVQSPTYRVQKSNSLAYSLLRAANQLKNDRRKT